MRRLTCLFAFLALAGMWATAVATPPLPLLQASGPAGSLADDLFLDSGQLLGNALSRGAALGDLNGNGHIDAFVANFPGPNEVWLNEGSGFFTGNGQSLGNRDSQAVALGDLNGNGYLDAVAANANGLNQVWLNDGSGHFSAGQTFEEANSRDVALGDLNGNGRLDAIFANANGNTVWFNNGDGTFSDSGQSLGQFDSFAVALADLNDNGRLDAFFANGVGGPDTVWFNDGSGLFSDSGQRLGAGWSDGVALGDLNGNGFVDAFIASSFPEPNLVWLNDGNGTFSDSLQRLGVAASNGVALGDLNGNGLPDIFIARNGPDTVWFNAGDGIYVDSDQILGSSLSLALALADLDGDGDLDAVVVQDSTPSLVIYFNQGGAQGGVQGIYLPGPQAIGGDLATDVALGDLNGNGHLDIFLTRHIGRPSQVWYNDGTGSFTDSDQSLTSNSQAVALADFDGDGDLDAVVADDDVVRLLWNMGGTQGGTEGIFTDSGQSLATALSLDMAVGDLDGDGDLDVVVATMNGGILTWINQGGAQGGVWGQLEPSDFPAGPTGNRQVALGDLDGDGDLDIFVARSGGNMVWLNQGGQQGGTEGLFADSGQQLGDLFSEDVALGDVDGDADLDVVVANFDGPTQVWFNGSGTPPINPEDWQVQLADTRGQTGLYPGLTLESNGRPHVSYVTYRTLPNGQQAYNLMYAFWDGRRWQRQLVDRNDYMGRHLGDVVANTAIALDSNGRPHIAYVAGNGPFGWADQNLKHAVWTGSTWQVEIVDDNDDTHPQISLAIDSQDRPHVSYARQEPARYVAGYAVRTEQGWQLEQVDAAEGRDVGRYSSLALDDNDQPHISYEDDGQETWLKYAHKTGGNWQIEPVVETGPFINRSFTSLALDKNGRPHISFLGNSEGHLRYVAWDGSNWQVQTVYTAAAGALLSGQTALALDDAGWPHITFVERSSLVEQLRYAHWDGATWQVETLDDKGQVGRFNSMALDSDDAPYIAYYDARFGDLRLAHWGPRWVHGPVDESGVLLAPSLALADQTPTIGYYNQSSGQVKGALWNGEWEIAPVAFVSNEVTATSLATSLAGQHLSYYDADNQRLVYASNAGGQWTTQIIDNSADVGRYNRLLLVRANSSNPGARIAYWDATSWRIKLALLDPGDPIQIVTNLAGPPLNSSSGPLDITLLSGGQIGVSYYDAFSGALRLATWQPSSQSWSDELITSANNVGSLHALQTDATTAQPVVTFYDAVSQAIRYTYRTDDGWLPPQTAVANVAQPTSLDMVLSFESLDRPRLLFTTEENRLYWALKQDGIWQVEMVVEANTSLDNARLALGDRPFLAYTQAGSLQLAHRTATLDVTSSAPNPERTDGAFNVLDACAALVNFFFDGSLRGLTGFHNQPPTFAQEPLPEPALFAALHALFATSAGGNHYIIAYAQYGAEMGQIGLQDPALLWDAYGTLQNFLPGLEALVTGQGDQFVVTQGMVDDALDIWQRLAAAGSPPLAATINGELAQYNNLQDFVGLTFAEWALAIGVNPTPERVYLPVVVRP
jgi:hypothetical protein